jgi:hypothetical protein
MAIGFLASTQVTNADATTTRTLSTYLKDTGAAPALADLAGDDVLLFCIAKGSSGASSPAAPTAGADTTSYAAIGAAAFGDGTDDVNLQVFAAKLKSIPAATSTVLATLPASGNAAYNQASLGFILRGINYDALIALNNGASLTNASGTATTVPNAPSATPTIAGSWLMVVGAGGYNAAMSNYALPADLSAATNHWRIGNNSGAGTQRVEIGAGFKENWASGAFDPAVFGGGTANARASWAASTIVIPPYVSSGKIKSRVGGAWVEKPVKVCLDGSTFVEKPLKVWSGSAWVLA